MTSNKIIRFTKQENKNIDTKTKLLATILSDKFYYLHVTKQMMYFPFLCVFKCVCHKCIHIFFEFFCLIFVQLDLVKTHIAHKIV